MAPKKRSALGSYIQLWVSADNWLRSYDAWMNDAFETLEPEVMEKDIQSWFRDTLKAFKFFQELPDCLAVAKTIRQQIETFRPHMPLIAALRNPGMRQRHWDALTAELGFELHPDTTLRSMKDVFALNLHAKEDAIMKICDIAERASVFTEISEHADGECPGPAPI